MLRITEVLHEESRSVRQSVGVAKDTLCEHRKKVVRCVVRVKDWFKLGVGLHQRSALRPFLFAIMDRPTGQAGVSVNCDVCR